ncbi:MAG: single-stranded DNA-binding protein [Bacilli bacterium]|jgi:single-strand DNA-binding protein|nr:single-stranded DNA-binding protein [Bacilli bacterium]MCH4201734.1 single-stranded DNA-binding protein [Bacilli bacterium]MCH4236180.1 single-stranded DNA-binding protein [Bacilli bacterium]HML99932.1 single-stranded DNA-binding protein [Bacilli bacterium]
MINRIILVGRLTRDPELRKTPNGASVASFTLAVDNRPTKGGEKSASFIPCIAWNLTADNVAKYTRKGSLVGVDGRLTQRTYDRRDGSGKAQVFEVVADSVQFLEPKGSGQPNVTDADMPEEDNSQNLDSVDLVGNDLPF